MGMLHKPFVVITIIAEVFGKRIVAIDKNVQNVKIILAETDMCCYNKDNLVHVVKRLCGFAKDRIKMWTFMFPSFIRRYGASGTVNGSAACAYFNVTGMNRNAG